jgi:hypothetical protein
MFVARSSGRVRFARTAFVLAGLLPCAGLIAWAVHLRSAGHRDAVRQAWAQAVGLPVGMAGIEHVRPGTIRARDVSIGDGAGGPVLVANAIEVETTATEVRLRLGSLRCDAPGARLLAGLAAEWLDRGARFPRDCVVEVADFDWQPAAGAASPTALRIECVAQGDARAVRAVLRGGDANDEVRVVRSVDAANPASVAWQVEADCARPVPLWVVEAVVGDASAAASPLGAAAVLTGRLTASRGAGPWQARARGRVADVDLASCSASLPGRVTGTAELLVQGLEWSDGRLASCAVECLARDGRVEQRLLDALVSVVGCRPGAAFGGAASADRRFAEVACGLVIDGGGIEVRGVDRAGDAVVTDERGAVLLQPVGRVPPERFAWLLAAPAAVYVPSGGAGAWLLSILPGGPGGGGAASSAGQASGTRGF